MHIYKICPHALWREAEIAGIFRGSPHDVRDGFIHYSTANQLAETARRHFAGQQDLLLLTVDGDQLAESLKFEPSRGGELFPHGYAPLSLAAVIAIAPFSAENPVIPI